MTEEISLPMPKIPSIKLADPKKDRWLKIGFYLVILGLLLYILFTSKNIDPCNKCMVSNSLVTSKQMTCKEYVNFTINHCLLKSEEWPSLEPEEIKQLSELV